MSNPVQATEKHGSAPTEAVPHFANGNEHPVLHVPFTVVIDGRAYEGHGISLVSAYAKGLLPPQIENSARVATLQFAFNGFAVNLPVDAQIVSMGQQSGLVELRFTQPTGPHLPQLRYILNAFVAGDLLRVGDVIQVADTRKASGSGGAGQYRLGFGGRLRQLVGITSALVLTVALAGVVAWGVYQRFYVLDVPGLSILTLEGETLRTTSSGQLDYINPQAGQGEVAFSLTSTSGQTISVAMPCDCQVMPAYAQQGATLLAGDPVLRVAAAQDRYVIETLATPEVVRALAEGGQARIDLPGGRQAVGRLPADPGMSLPYSAAQASEIRIALVAEGEITAEDVGKPVSVRIEKSPFLAELVSSATDLLGAGRG